MSRVEAAAGLDRLPWLPDEPRPQAARRRGVTAPLVALLVLAGAIAAWLGLRNVEERGPAVSQSTRAATVRLPSARLAVPPQPQVKIAPAPEVEPIVAPPMPVIEPTPVVRRTPQHVVRTPRQNEDTAPVASQAPKVAEAAPTQPWPVRVVDGAAGRLVRIGAFSTVHQAKRGWWAIVRVNPALKRLPALVVPVRSLRNGRVYYRLQMGTTSQAHSAVLCQRMRMIAEPCVVIGTPGGQ